MSSDSLNMFSELIYAMGLGVAALWLTAGCWGEKNRFTRFLLSLLVLGGYGLFTWFCSSGGDDTLLLPACIFLGLSALLLSVSITISGWLGRGHPGISSLLFWLLICLLAISTTIILPFFLFARIASQGSVGWTEFLVSVALLGSMNYAILLPFLLLSSVNQHYRLQIMEMLGWARETSPPAILRKPALFTQTVSPGSSPQNT